MLYAVTAMPFDGGSIFLGKVCAENEDEACDLALNKYASQSHKNAKEIEELGGHIALDAQLLAL